MRHPTLPLLLAASVSLFASQNHVFGQAAKAKLASVKPHYDAPDQPFRMAPMPQSTRSLVVPLATNLHLAFDTALLRTHTVWSGRGLALLGPQYGLPKSPFISTNDGTVLWTMPPVFPWAVGKMPEKLETKLPSYAAFEGVQVLGTSTVFRYSLKDSTGRLLSLNERFGTLENRIAGLRRAVEFGPSRDDLWFLAHIEQGRAERLSATTLLIERAKDVLLLRLDGFEMVVQDAKLDLESETATEQGSEKGNPRQQIKGDFVQVFVKIPARPQGKPVSFRLDSEVFPTKEQANKRRMLIETARWNDGRQTPMEPSRLSSGGVARPSSSSTPHFRSESFPLPKEANLLLTGMDFLPNGDLVVCTWPGEVWVIESAQGSPAAAKYRRFARGLAEPMGLAVRDGKIYVGTKQALYRLTDTDGNGEADLFECLNQSWGYTGSYNAFAYGPVFDKAGNFILANAGHSGRWDAPYMGWGIRISPDGAKLDAICSGFREPNGISTFGPDRDVFVSENQGQWMAACKLNHVTPGKFYGHPSAWPAPQEEYGKHTRFDPPAVWFPYKLARSTTGICEITDDRFGPFRGQLMVGDFQNAIVTRVQLEKVNGEYQGAVWPFLKQFQSGVNRLAYGPDGKLYVGGCQAPLSWKAVAPLDFALERISYTGKLPFEVKAVHALRDGFELTFTQPVEEKAAANPDSYDVTQYGYKYHSKYGSPELDHDGKENAATVIKVAGATVSPDKLKVRLKLEGWKPGYVTMVRSLDVKNATGDNLVNDTFWYTLNQLPK
jgi:glucose/arabinose dehydrogenase